MATNWDEFDKKVDCETLAKEAKESGKGEYVDVPDGEYEVVSKKMELKMSKSGKPMASMQLKIVAGQYKGSNIFLNQVIEQPFQIHIMNELLRAMFDADIEFVCYSQYNQLLLQCAEDAQNLSWHIEYKTDAKGYKNIEIKEVFENE